MFYVCNSVFDWLHGRFMSLVLGVLPLCAFTPSTSFAGIQNSRA